MSTLSRCASIGVLAPLSLLLVACSAESDTSTDNDFTTQEDMARTVATMMAGNDSLSTTSEALSQTGLSTMLDGPSSYTMIAPTNTAFESVEGSAELISNDARAPLLAALLREHIIPGALTTETILEAIEQKGGTVEMRTLGNGTITFDRDGESVLLSSPSGHEARLASGAMVGSNGVVLPVDGILSDLPSAD